MVRATDIVIAAAAPGFPGEDLEQAVRDLAARCDLLYLHIDSDILDASLGPEPWHPGAKRPSMEQVRPRSRRSWHREGRGYAFVSVWPAGEGGDIAVDSGSS